MKLVENIGSMEVVEISRNLNQDILDALGRMIGTRALSKYKMFTLTGKAGNLGEVLYKLEFTPKILGDNSGRYVVFNPETIYENEIYIRGHMDKEVVHIYNNGSNEVIIEKTTLLKTL